MEGLAEWIIIGVVAWWFYKTGKRTGSREGYNVGRSRKRKQHRQRYQPERRGRPSGRPRRVLFLAISCMQIQFRLRPRRMVRE